MLDREFKYFLDNKAELLKEYNGKFIVIKGDEVIGSYSNEEEAFFETEKKHKAGSFLIQLCEPGEDAYTQTYHSRVSFLNV